MLNTLAPVGAPANGAPVLVVNENEAARLIGVSKSWIAHKRIYGGGPTYLKLGPRRVVYTMAALHDFIARQKPRQNTAEYPHTGRARKCEGAA